MKLRFLLCFLTVLLTSADLPADDIGPALDVKSGTVACVFNPDVVRQGILASVQFRKLAPGGFNRTKDGIVAPIVGGFFSINDLRAELIASGGFQLNYNGYTVSLVDFIFTLPNDGAPASVSASLIANRVYLNRIVLSTIDIADLHIPNPIVIPSSRKLLLKNIPLKLTTDAAASLNNALTLSNAYNDTDLIATLSLSFKIGRQY